MFLELMNDLLINSSMFYVYFGMIIATIGISQLLLMQYHGLNSRRSVLTEQVNIPISSSHEQLFHVFNEPFIVWFGKSCKRMFTTDDDLEDNNSSYFIRTHKIRGGQLWTKTSYAPPFVNIDMHC